MNLCCKNDNDFEEKDMEFTYRELVACLLYFAVYKRPDIANKVSQLAHFVSKQMKKHWEAFKNVLKYVKGTKAYGLCYS